MLLIGAHQSISGGHYRALQRGSETGCAAVQIFVGPNMSWRRGRLTPAQVRKFAETRAETGILSVTAHNSYLVNLASTDPRIRGLSLDATVDELKRCEALDIPSLVIHPGAHLGAGEKPALVRVARGIDRAIEASETRRVRVLLETTAGQGTVLGAAFEHLADVISLSAFPERLAVCYDTCHTFVAGYDIRSRADYDKTMRQFDRVIGLDRLLCFHFNDALKPLGSRRDRHAHIGKGCLGEEAFAHILTDPRFESIPKILETPKGTRRKRSWDAINLETLRRLAGET